MKYSYNKNFLLDEIKEIGMPIEVILDQDGDVIALKIPADAPPIPVISLCSLLEAVAYNGFQCDLKGELIESEGKVRIATVWD